jgi:predicted ATP-dependent serine protease
MFLTPNEIKSLKEEKVSVLKTEQEKFDSWFSNYNGLVLGSAVYVSGTSGAGKTTLMLNIMSWLKQYDSCFYSREMRIKDLFNQINGVELTDKCKIADIDSCENFDKFMQGLELIKPKVIIIDSLQVIAKEDYVYTKEKSEDDACYYIIKRLRDFISKNNSILFLIGHNTKEGNFAGNNVIIQMMDAHIDMVYDKKTKLRTMSWGQKNRKGKMGSLNYEIDNSKILFNNEHIKYNQDECNLKRILNNSLSFIESEIDSIKFDKSGKMIKEEKILEMKKRYFELKKKNEKKFFIKTDNPKYFDFIDYMFYQYFSLVRDLQYFDEDDD